MRITVSGGSGFVGKALVSYLLARGDRVTVMGRDAERAKRAFAGHADTRGLDFVSWNAGDDACAPLDAIEGRPEHGVQVRPTRLIVRESTG